MKSARTVMFCLATFALVGACLPSCAVPTPVAPVTAVRAMPTATSPEPSPTPRPAATAMPTQQPTATPVAISALPAPTAMPSPNPETPQSDVRAYWETLAIPTYPFEAFLRPQDTFGGLNVLALDRAAYEASMPSPVPKAYRALVVENEYLRLTFLPDLGGRLYQCVFKPTGQSIFYNNAVIKPSYWGPLSRDQNWWLAVGGLEWALPVQEHGYQWGVPWDVSVGQEAERITVRLRNPGETERLAAEIAVSLAAHEARFTVEARLTNAAGVAVPVQFWANAMLSPGSTTVGPDLQFVFPADQVVVHSTGDASLPAEHSSMPWPDAGGRDLSRYANWRNWLGAFAADEVPGFVGAYSTKADIGVARVVSGAAGAKLFGFGSEFPDVSTYADDGSAYVELWVGANRTFWPEDDHLLQPGDSAGWSEVWLPVAGLGGYDAATGDGVLRAERQGDSVVLGAAVPMRRNVVLRLVVGDAPLFSRELSLAPGAPYRETVSLEGLSVAGQAMHLQMADENGMLLAETAF